MLIDIDKMGLVNAWFGDRAGDELLNEVGQAIQAICRREDAICRLENDTFGVLIGDAGLQDMNEIAIRTRLELRGISSIRSDHRAIQVTSSIGFATSRFSIGASIVREANDALARAQGDGGDCIRAGRELAELKLVA